MAPSQRRTFFKGTPVFGASSSIIIEAGPFAGISGLFGAEKSAGVILGRDGGAGGDGGVGGAGGGGTGRENSRLSSGGVNGFGADPAPPVSFIESKSDLMVRRVISGGGGGGGAGRLEPA